MNTLSFFGIEFDSYVMTYVDGKQWHMTVRAEELKSDGAMETTEVRLGEEHARELRDWLTRALREAETVGESHAAR